METWTRQLKRSAPLTRHYAVAIVDATGDTIERIEVSTLTYTALRRIAHDTPAQAALKHTPGVRHTLSVQWLKHELLRHLAEL